MVGAVLTSTLGGVLVMPRFAELGRSALSPAMQMFIGPTLGLIVALFGSALLGRGRIDPLIFTVVFLASRFGLDLVMRQEYRPGERSCLWITPARRCR